MHEHENMPPRLIPSHEEALKNHCHLCRLASLISKSCFQAKKALFLPHVGTERRISQECLNFNPSHDSCSLVRWRTRPPLRRLLSFAHVNTPPPLALRRTSLFCTCAQTQTHNKTDEEDPANLSTAWYCLPSGARKKDPAP